jgi:nanoRNase/pAp phosphatase (c-di-AMP/oligoRNAs hydrolase)
MQPFDIVIYHGNCYDGFTSAWVARKHSPDATFIPAQYGDTPPDVAGKRVLIVDFSYPRAQLLELHEVATYLFVLDHHKTAQADLEGLSFCVFDMERSGASLAWDTLFPREMRPPLVSMIEDRDLWRFDIPDSKAYHAALTSVPMTFENWDAVARLPVLDVVRNGQAILSFTLLVAGKFAARARAVMLSDVEVWAVNVPVEFVSETAEVLKDREPHRPILGFSWDGERGNWYCSLRSRDDGPDVSAIAKRFGGGGHMHAAGFRLPGPPSLDDLPW